MQERRVDGERLARIETLMGVMGEQLVQIRTEQVREYKELQTKLSALETSVLQLNTGQRLADLEVKVADLTKLKQRIIGYTSAIAAIATIAFALVKDKVLTFLGFGS